MDGKLELNNYFRIRFVDEPPYFKIRFVGKDKAIIEGVDYVEMPKRQEQLPSSNEGCKETENDEMLQN